MGASRILNLRSRGMERQLTDSDCAVWAIKAICYQLGVAVPPANLVRKHIEIKSRGTTIRDVRDALLAFGVSAQPVQGPSNAIAEAPLPAVALIKLEEHAFHYVVVTNANGRTVSYLDSSVGSELQTVLAAKFAEQFTGSLILCEKQPDYVDIDFGQEIKPNKFICSVLKTETNSALALAVGEVFQLLMLLVGILMLKNFFGSSIFGMPNFWFLAGIAICAIAYMWVGKFQQLIRSEIKSRCLFTLFGLATRLIKTCELSSKKGIRDKAARCISATSSVAQSLTGVVSLPGSTFSLILFVALVGWIDMYAGWYAIGLAAILPIISLWTKRRIRFSSKSVLRLKERNEIGLVYLMAKQDPDMDFVDDMPWNQVELCDAVAKHDDNQSVDGLIGAAVGRLSVFAGLLIGGLQHQELGIGHTIAVFFLLSIYSSVVGRWSKHIAALPESQFQVRSLLDFLSDFTLEPLRFSMNRDSTDMGEFTNRNGKDVATRLTPGGMS